MVSLFDIFTIGIGPSSSHTVGPMRAARLFAEGLEREGNLDHVASVKAELYGSLGLTGPNHGSGGAIILGLLGETPENVAPEKIPGILANIEESRQLSILGKKAIPFHHRKHLVFHRRGHLPGHTNGMRFTACQPDGKEITQRTYYSVGGGFIVEGEVKENTPASGPPFPYPFHSSSELLTMASQHDLFIDELMLENEKALRSQEEVTARLLEIWRVMQECARQGLEAEGELPGGLHVKRRAPALYQSLGMPSEQLPGALPDPLAVMDWVSTWAIAVNEQNAAGARVVTAPTNGAAGIIPAVLLYYSKFAPHNSADGVFRFLLTAGAIANLYRENASISGAAVGCQGEVGVAASMAAAGLVRALGGSNEQTENAAEIAMEHHLGLTCDPVGGLVQIPCIERNAMGAVKAIIAARLALYGDGRHHVSLDNVIQTMRQTGADMMTKYKETSRGGLAVNVIEC